MIGIRTHAYGAVALGLLWAVGPLAAATQTPGRTAHPGSRIIYHLLDREVTEAARRAGALCREQGLEFVWGADPRFAATPIIRATGHGAELLMVNRPFQVRLDGADAEGPNESGRRTGGTTCGTRSRRAAISTCPPRSACSWTPSASTASSPTASKAGRSCARACVT